MAYVVNGGAILQIQIVGVLDGQTTRNVFRYRYGYDQAPLPDGKASALEIMSQFAAAVYTPLINAVSTAWSLQYIAGQWIKPVRYRPIQQTAADMGIGAAGLIAGAYEATTVAAVVSVFCEQGGRKFQGRRFFAGVPQSSVTASVLNGGGLAEFNDVKDGMVQSLVDGLGGVYYGTLSKSVTGPPDDQAIRGGIVHTPLRVQRRREVGRGE